MREEIILWIKDSDYDLSCANDMLKAKKYNYAVFFSRQATEKILKAAYLLILKKPFPKEHNLNSIIRVAVKKIPDNIQDDINFLNPHYTITRYADAAIGTPSELYDIKTAKEAIKRAEEVRKWVKKITASKNSSSR